MKTKNETDIKITSDGDFVLDSSADFEYATDTEFIKQIVMTRVKTMKPDWFYDNVGANLEELLGKDNTKDTAELGATNIINALTYDGFLTSDDIYIKPSPVDEFTIVYVMAIRIEDMEPLVFKVDIALSSGINIEEV